MLEKTPPTLRTLTAVSSFSRVFRSCALASAARRLQNHWEDRHRIARIASFNCATNVLHDRYCMCAACCANYLSLSLSLRKNPFTSPNSQLRSHSVGISDLVEYRRCERALSPPQTVCHSRHRDEAAERIKLFTTHYYRQSDLSSDQIQTD